MPDLPPLPPSVFSLPALPQRWHSSPDWVRDFNGEPVFRSVAGRPVLVAIRWVDDCAPPGFTQLGPGMFFPDDTAEGQRWKTRMAWTQPHPHPPHELAARP